MSETRVPCNGCTVCCQNELLILHPEHGDDPRDYDTQKVTNPLNGKRALALRQKDNGDCTYLGETGCSIYGRRPAICREFDCRLTVLLFEARPHKERLALKRSGLVDRRVFRAGKERLASLIR